MPLPKTYIFDVKGCTVGHFNLSESNWPDAVMSLKKTAYVTNFIIGADYRNRGYGKRMILFAIDKARENGYNHVSLWVNKNNPVAIKTYLGADFIKYRQHRVGAGKSNIIRMYRKI
jgi:ribosomal protein S18 acetylase RimI-like enzyme